MFRADYDFEQGKFSESIVAGTTCGELPFFSDTPRTATVVAEKRTIAWLLDEESLDKLQKEHPEVGYELMKICLKLTSERLSAITGYVTLYIFHTNYQGILPLTDTHPQLHPYHCCLI